ncbi:biopolymer transporter ExbD [Botrimarina sp.]|uniref:biopolymer transporter ExbD n=1 Tax=Botrimarina sp. TaxID=2795802 RepID=UPI0032ECC053
MRTPRAPRTLAANPLAAAMTPMIDVVFLLLVFFLCTASFQEPEENLAASLAYQSADAGSGAGEATRPPLEEIAIAGRRVEGRTLWTVNDGPQAADPATLARLLADLAAIDRSLPVTIDPAAGVPMGDAVAAYDAARAAGLGRVLLVASDAGADEGEPAR